jgi:hypothetical protein
MARRRKGSDPGLVLIEGAAALGGMLLLLLFINDPKAGRALFSLIPLAVIGFAALVVLFLLIRFAFRSGTSMPSGSGVRNVIDDLERRIPFSESGKAVFPKVQADREREPILSLEEKLDRLDWFQFEKLIALLYSARGCNVERRGGANPDGGIDLIVDSGTERFAVQCKFWKAYEVGVRQVREFLGALQDAGIPEGVIVSIKGFTAPARELAARHKIELIGKSSLLGMLKDASFTPHIREINAIMDSDDKRCPKCERQMLLRTSSKDGSKFWGCSAYPRCRFKMNLRTA